MQNSQNSNRHHEKHDNYHIETLAYCEIYEKKRECFVRQDFVLQHWFQWSEIPNLYHNHRNEYIDGEKNYCKTKSDRTNNDLFQLWRRCEVLVKEDCMHCRAGDFNNKIGGGVAARAGTVLICHLLRIGWFRAGVFGLRPQFGLPASLRGSWCCVAGGVFGLRPQTPIKLGVKQSWGILFLAYGVRTL